jgi:hypothetical protein
MIQEAINSVVGKAEGIVKGTSAINSKMLSLAESDVDTAMAMRARRVLQSKKKAMLDQRDKVAQRRKDMLTRGLEGVLDGTKIN